MDISDGQKFALVKLCGMTAKERNARLYLLSNLTGRTIESSSNIQVNEWRKIRDAAYPRWTNNDWSVSEEFLSKCRQIYEDYETSVLGQMKLF